MSNLETVSPDVERDVLKSWQGEPTTTDIDRLLYEFSVESGKRLSNMRDPFDHIEWLHSVIVRLGTRSYTAARSKLNPEESK